MQTLYAVYSKGFSLHEPCFLALEKTALYLSLIENKDHIQKVFSLHEPYFLALYQSLKKMALYLSLIKTKDSLYYHIILCALVVTKLCSKYL